MGRIIYTECEREAQNIIQQAKCLTKLMNTRDQARDQVRDQKSSSSYFSNLNLHNEDNPLKILLKAVLETNWKTVGDLLKKSEQPIKPTQEPSPNFKPRLKRSTTCNLQKAIK